MRILASNDGEGNDNWESQVLVVRPFFPSPGSPSTFTTMAQTRGFLLVMMVKETTTGSHRCLLSGDCVGGEGLGLFFNFFVEKKIIFTLYLPYLCQREDCWSGWVVVAFVRVRGQVFESVIAHFWGQGILDFFFPANRACFSSDLLLFANRAFVFLWFCPTVAVISTVWVQAGAAIFSANPPGAQGSSFVFERVVLVFRFQCNPFIPCLLHCCRQFNPIPPDLFDYHRQRCLAMNPDKVGMKLCEF